MKEEISGVEKKKERLLMLKALMSTLMVTFMFLFRYSHSIIEWPKTELNGSLELYENAELKGLIVTLFMTSSILSLGCSITELCTRNLGHDKFQILYEKINLCGVVLTVCIILALVLPLQKNSVKHNLLGASQLARAEALYIVLSIICCAVNGIAFLASYVLFKKKTSLCSNERNTPTSEYGKTEYDLVKN